MISGDRLRDIFQDVAETCGCTVKALNAVAAAVLRDATPDTLTALAEAYQHRADHGVGWEEYYAERADEEAR